VEGMPLAEVNLFLAFGAGLLSFVSPCVLPIYPAFLSYITGMSLHEVQDKGLLQKQSLLHYVFLFARFFFSIPWPWFQYKCYQ